MKRTLFAAGWLVLAGCATATPEPAVEPVKEPVVVAKPLPPPEPADPAPVIDGDVTEAWVGGMQVIVKRVKNADLASSQLNIRGGARNWTAENAGIEALALSVAASGGTSSSDKQAFVTHLASIGSTLVTRAGADASSLRAKGLLARWDETFAMLGDAFLHPAMPAAEIELQRSRQIAMLHKESESPDGRLELAANQLVFARHPYSNRAIGSEATVAKLDAAALSAHLAKLRERSRLMLVVVGDVDPAQVLEATRKIFGSLPRGNYVASALPVVSFASPRVQVREEKLPTHFIKGVFIGPSWKDADFPVAIAAMGALQYREFTEVRTRRNLSYAPAAYFQTATSVPLGALYVTAVDPGTTIKVMFDEARKLKTELVPPAELAGATSIYLTGFLMENESTDGQAAVLSQAQLLAGDWRALRDLPARVKAVTPEQVKAFAQKYLGHLQIVVLGEKAKVDQALFESL